MAVKNVMTPDELRNNYEFKVVKRALMNQNKWIKDVTFDDNDLNRFNTIFLDLIVDPIQMANEYERPFLPWVVKPIENGEGYRATYPSLLLDMSYEEGDNLITSPMNQMMDDIHNSPALPVELRLPEGRSFHVGAFVAPEQ